MEAPQTKQELQSFLGMITYLGQYVKNLSDLTSNLRSLLKKDALFQWTESHEANFQKLKESISSDTCLIYFDTSKPVTLQVDASLKGFRCMSSTRALSRQIETSCICIQKPHFS